MTEKEALAREVELVALYGRRQKGGKLVNLTDGGEGVSGKIYSKEERKRISDRIKSNLEYFQSFGERSKYFGKQLFGEDNPNYGNKGDKNPLSKKVVQLDLHGNFIKEFSSITEAGEATGISSTGISAVCTKRRNQIRGYVFRYKEDYDMNGSSVSLGPTNKKAVYQINKQTKEIIKEYPSTSSTKEDGFNPTNVGQVCRGEKKSHKGYIWKYKEEYDNSN